MPSGGHLAGNVGLGMLPCSVRENRHSGVHGASVKSREQREWDTELPFLPLSLQPPHSPVRNPVLSKSELSDRTSCSDGNVLYLDCPTW